MSKLHLKHTDKESTQGIEKKQHISRHLETEKDQQNDQVYQVHCSCIYSASNEQL